jgi:hypothetical protein
MRHLLVPWIAPVRGGKRLMLLPEQSGCPVRRACAALFSQSRRRLPATEARFPRRQDRLGPAPLPSVLWGREDSVQSDRSSLSVSSSLASSSQGHPPPQEVGSRGSAAETLPYPEPLPSATWYCIT